MATVNVELLGTIRPDGSLELDQKVPLPPGRVRVRLEVSANAGEPDATAATDPALVGRFRDLVREWKAATTLMSSITEMATHPAYQQIIGMGKEAIPLLLEELRQTPDHWFWALKAITSEDPVPPADRGKLRPMTEAWLAWAEAHGYR
jgi:hypothetical protein